MGGMKGKAAQEEEIVAILEALKDRERPKAERIQLMKALVAKGKELPDEILNEALKKLMERMLD